MPKRTQQEEALLKESEEFILNMLRATFGMDIELIEDERDEESIPADDPIRNNISLRINSFSVPFSIPPKVIEQLKKFFEEKGWEFVNMTSTPSIKLRRIQPAQ
jgi:hypothetical protein